MKSKHITTYPLVFEGQVLFDCFTANFVHFRYEKFSNFHGLQIIGKLIMFYFHFFQIIIDTLLL